MLIAKQPHSQDAEKHSMPAVVNPRKSNFEASKRDNPELQESEMLLNYTIETFLSYFTLGLQIKGVLIEYEYPD